MDFSQIKFYAEKYLAVLTSVGTAAVMSIVMGASNKINNGGFFRFSNPIVKALNDKVSKVASEKFIAAKEEFTNKYTEVSLINSNNFQTGVNGLTDGSQQKLKVDFINKLKKFDPTNEKLKSLQADVAYGEIIGSSKAYENKNDFMKVVDMVKDDDLKNFKFEETIKLDDVKFDEVLEIKDNKLGLKTTKSQI